MLPLLSRRNMGRGACCFASLCPEKVAAPAGEVWHGIYLNQARRKTVSKKNKRTGFVSRFRRGDRGKK